MQFIRLVQRMPDNAYMSQVTEFDDDDESDDDMGRQDEEIPPFWGAVREDTGSSGRMCVPLPTRKQ